MCYILPAVVLFVLSLNAAVVDYFIGRFSANVFHSVDGTKTWQLVRPGHQFSLKDLRIVNGIIYLASGCG